MPIYEYRCECENEREAILPFQDANLPQICKCGKVMRKQMPVSSFTMKQTGNQMALDTLNSKQMPRKHWTGAAEKAAAAGL